MIEWLPWLPSKSCYTNLKFFETLKDTPNPSKGFRFVAFLVLEILGGGGPFRPPPPWCLVWVPKPLVPGGLISLDTEVFLYKNFVKILLLYENLSIRQFIANDAFQKLQYHRQVGYLKKIGINCTSLKSCPQNV